jgi:hypothetical protein
MTDDEPVVSFKCELCRSYYQVEERTIRWKPCLSLSRAEVLFKVVLCLSCFRAQCSNVP